MRTMISNLALKVNNPWDSLDSNDARRVDIHGHYDFFWVVLEGGAPGLMLRLPSIPKNVSRLPKLKNLFVSFRSISSGAAFVIALKERSQVEIFHTLCMDVVAAGESGSDINDALLRAIQRTQRWQYLLRGGSKAGLSVEEQRGLVGELAILRKFIDALGPEAALEAWTGPSGASKDFEFIGACVEVKTMRAAAKPVIFISSEQQLTDVDGCRLFLSVLSVASAVTPDGLTLHDYVNITSEMIEGSAAALDSWEEAIYSTGYDLSNDYDDRCWSLGKNIIYEVHGSFPRIRNPLDLGIEEVKYSLSLDACSDFILDGDIIKIIKEGI